MQLLHVDHHREQVARAGQVTPVSCLITISWPENAVAMNSQEATAEAAAPATNQNPTYVLYVEP